MRKNREFINFFYNPVFYVIFASFVVLVAYRFNSLLLSYIDSTGFYPQFTFDVQMISFPDLDINTYIFPKLFDFVYYLLIIFIPVLFPLVSQDRQVNMDKFELCMGKTEFVIILSKVYSTVKIILIITLPVTLFPLVLGLFAKLDWSMLLYSYIGLIFLVIFSASTCALMSIVNIKSMLIIMINIVFLMFLRLFFIENIISLFSTGLIYLNDLLFIVIWCMIFMFMSVTLYRGLRIYK